ncbi:MAG: MltA domain-containing protein [Desulfuromonas sp.]|nr:MltA domain-containing protein [Desulfuromonas sp.]
MSVFLSELFGRRRNVLVIVMLLWLAGCAVKELDVAPEKKIFPAQRPMQAALWEDLPGWQEDSFAEVFSAFNLSCRSLRFRPDWQDVCSKATQVSGADSLRDFFHDFFVPWRLVDKDGRDEGLITGYYVPDIDGSRQSSSRYPYPLYKKPDDMLVIDLASVYPELGSYRLRGRVDGQRVIPYWSREQIDGMRQPLHGQELFWVADPVELFFLQVQGSGRVNLDDGSQVMVNYAAQNGHPYRSIGKLLLERGEMTRDQMSMQNIAAWGREHPQRVQQLLNENPSYVFFRPLEEGVTSPPGALGVPLTPQRSLAVDPRVVPLGAPVYLATSWPNTDRPLQQLMVAQDTGGAIKGRIRADFFWGVGDEAGEQAGRMKQSGQMWVLLPKGMAPVGAGD